MRKSLRWLLPPLIILGAVVLTFLLIASRPQPPRQEAPVTTPLVDVQPARALAGDFSLRAQGTVLPRTQTTLVSEVAGAVTEVSPKFQVGEFFRRGDVLLRIDAKDYQAALRRAEAAVANRQALLAQETARAEQALKDWQNLRRTGEPSDLVLRKPYVAEAEANLRSAQADLQQARINLERTSIRAPYDGLLREKRVDLGQYVSPGSALALVNGTDHAEIRLPLTELDAGFVPLPGLGSRRGEAIPVTLHANVAGVERSWQAALVRSESVIDERSRVVYAVASIADPYRLDSGDGQPLPFGTFVHAVLPANVGHAVLAVPREAVRGGNQVMVVDGEGRLRLREVHIVRGDSDHAFVDGGVEVGERIVVSTLETPVDGMAVRVRGEQADADAVASTTAESVDDAPPAGE